MNRFVRKRQSDIFLKGTGDATNMSGYASVESTENLPVATPKVEMVEVEAPGTLSAGYTFQASYNGVVFPVTVVRAIE